MSMLALNESLLRLFYRIFIRKEKVEYDWKVIQFIKYIQLPVAISVHQLSPNLHQPQFLKQQGSLFTILQKDNDLELVKATKLKLMLTDKDTQNSFITVNIENDKIDINFSATYKKGESKRKAREHIKALLEDAKEIEIYDKYLARVNNGFDVWSQRNFPILRKILPQKNIKIKIFCEDWNNSREADLKNLYGGWAIEQSWDNELNRKIHDRYIVTDKVEIILSSGLSNLDDRGKDFTYIVKIR